MTLPGVWAWTHISTREAGKLILSVSPMSANRL